MIYNMDFLISAMVILLLNFSLITILLHTTAIWKMPQSS